jgi:putative DNA methylase
MRSVPRPAPRIRGKNPRKSKEASGRPEVPQDKPVTTLDRIHAALLLQAGGQANSLRALLKSEGERGPEFLRLANAPTALYPRDSDEKRL